MTYRLLLLRRAERDLESIFTWIEQRSADGATRWLRSFRDAVENVVRFPDGCSLASEHELAVEGIRQFLFRTLRGSVYRAIFVIVGNEVRILRIRGPGQSDLTTDELPDPGH